MKRLSLFFGILLATSCSFFAQSNSKIKLDFPVTKQRLVQVLKENETEEALIISIIRKNGVNFALTPAVEGELKTVKASPKILTTIRQNQRAAIGVANGKATNLVIPKYPGAAKAVRATGAVNVIALIDEEGNVVDANAVSGHPLLKQAAEEAALASKFSPTTVNKQKVKVTGIIVYNFVVP